MVRVSPSPSWTAHALPSQTGPGREVTPPPPTGSGQDVTYPFHRCEQTNTSENITFHTYVVGKRFYWCVNIFSSVTVASQRHNTFQNNIIILYLTCKCLTILLYSADNGCGGAFTADNGVMISPDYPNPYPHNAQCVYTVTVHQNEVMNLTITNLELEQPIGGSCEWDYVEVRKSKVFLFF